MDVFDLVLVENLHWTFVELLQTIQLVIEDFIFLKGTF